MMNEEDVRHVLSHPLTMPEVDVSPRTTHPRWTGTFPRLIGKYVREEKLISLEEAIRKITSYPAQRIGLFDRGQLRPGMAADITVFDFDTITDRSTYENPLVDPEGIRYVFVNGESVVENGQHTGSRTGKVLRRG